MRLHAIPYSRANLVRRTLKDEGCPARTFHQEILMKSVLTLAALLLSATLVPATHANSPAQDSAPSKKSKVRRITGCIGRGATDRDYTIDTANGSTWEIKSDAVNFESHVGHTVTITGTVDHAKLHAAKEKAKDTAKGGEKPEHGHLTVTTLKMVSKSCQH
jgi:hypothetical protein